MDDLISRQAAMEEISKQQTYKMFEGEDTLYLDANDVGSVLASLPSAQPERLTDDDFETIRIHLNAYKEKLCNQHRWEEADEYQRIIDRFMAFASAQPDISAYSDKLWKRAYERGKAEAQDEIVRCKDCKHWLPHTQFGYDEDNDVYYDYCAKLIPEDEYYAFQREANDYCSRAERRTDE